MILNASQLKTTTAYLKYLSQGKSKTEAADLVNTPRKTIARWVDADNAPTAPATSTVTATKPVAAKATLAPQKKTVTIGAKKPAKVVPVGVSKEDSDKAKKESPINALVPFQAISLPNAFMVVRDGLPVQIDKSHQNFAKIKEIIANVKNQQIYSKDLETLFDLIDLKSSLAKFSQGRVVVDDTGVKVDGKPLHGSLANVMMNTLKTGDMTRLTAFAKFHDKMMEAISFKVTKRLFEFVSKTGLKIDDDGDIIALKVVRGNYLDKHSGTFDNTPGKTCEVARNQVDDDDNKTCSYGLHVCAPGYIKEFSSRSGGDKLVEVKVDPRDFVAIPPDYNFDKARCCKYIVLKDVSKAYKTELYNTKD